MKKLLALLLCGIMLLSASVCSAAEWPEEAINLVVTASAGGGTDILARDLLPGLLDKGTFSVENNTVGNGVVAFEKVKAENPEEINEIVFFNTGLFANYATGVTDINPVTDLTPVYGMDQDGVSYLIVPKDSPFNSVDDVVAYCKENPGKLNFGANIGDAPNIIAGYLMQELGVEWNWVSTGTDGDRVSLIMGGNLDITNINQATTWNYYKNDDIKVLCAINGKSELAPEKLRAVPSLEECGYNNVPIKVRVYVWAPNGADTAVYEQINEVFNYASTREAYIDTMTNQRGNLYYSVGDFEAARKTAEEELALILDVCKNLGIARDGV